MARTTRCKRTFVRDDDIELEVTFEFTPGTPESGNHGPPEDYDPGSGPEIYILHACVIGGDATQRVTMDKIETERFEIETLEDPDFDPDPERE